MTATMTTFLLAWEVCRALDCAWWDMVSDRGDGSFEEPWGPYARLSGARRVIVTDRVHQVAWKDQVAQLRDNPPYRLRHWRCRSYPRRS